MSGSGQRCRNECGHRQKEERPIAPVNRVTKLPVVPYEQETNASELN